MTQLRFNQKPQLPMILQEERAECGHACVAMIANFFGHNLDLYGIRSLSQSSSHGVTLLDIHRLLERLGLAARPLKVPMEELHLIKFPAILHWNMNHFVVLKKVTPKYVIIHDPAVGIRRCSLEEVSNAFTGVVLEVDKSEDFTEIRSQNKLSLFDLIKTIRGINTFMMLLLVLSFSIEVLCLLNPLFLQYVTDDVIGFNEPGNLYVIAAGFLILMLLQVLTEYGRGNLVIYITNRMTEQFSSNVVRHLLKLPLAFFEKRHKGDLQSKFQSIDHIQKKISTDFVNTVLDGFMIVIHLMVMTVYSPLLTMLVLMGLLLSLGIRYSSYQRLKNQTETSIQQHAKAATVFLETLQGILPIKSFLKERVRLQTWRNSYVDSLNADINVSKMNLFYQVAQQLLGQFEHIVVVCIGATLVLSHKFSVGMLMAFLSYRLLLVTKASSFLQNIVDYKLISIQLHRVSDILFQQPEVISERFGELKQMKGSLSLKQIAYRYHPEDKEVFKNLTLRIQAGEKVAIVGPSGCGKSTLLKVMMGLLENTDGEIYIDDISINEFGLNNYRALSASVMQDDTLLSGSILDNIAFFDEQIDRDRVLQVAKLSAIHDVIATLPMGYETLVGDMGSVLSGGQKQRILLARALYKQPKILFLDEATSHLDSENEKHINDSLRALDITQVIIAHRVETIRMADRVIDLSESYKGN